ncbi:AsnC family transcriptional regulator [Agromyces sp. CFH 90414]|uniref:AsnC family transcriptional regulator n=1 Tax=Agromyces agglutinans TaxID=2662258 RepID=A0A6I2F2Q8_9MICO|nr:Lrp/AsnC family transcriptional regulator [Agromyces agglutinans]MRG58461.1 AsnC family transcriptional regulator [Agromyces agglutinans]
MTEHAHRGEPLDPIDRRIVAELSRDGRLSVRTLAERVHISRTAAHNRLLHLQQRGVITGFGAQIDRRAIGLSISALVVVRVGDVPWEGLARTLAALPFVEKVQAVSGDLDLILTVSAPDHEQLSQAILRDIQELPGVVSTRSHLILAEVPGRPPAQALDVWRK